MANTVLILSTVYVPAWTAVQIQFPLSQYVLCTPKWRRRRRWRKRTIQQNSR